MSRILEPERTFSGSLLTKLSRISSYQFLCDTASEHKKRSRAPGHKLLYEAISVLPKPSETCLFKTNRDRKDTSRGKEYKKALAKCYKKPADETPALSRNNDEPAETNKDWKIITPRRFQKVPNKSIKKPVDERPALSKKDCNLNKNNVDDFPKRVKEMLQEIFANVNVGSREKGSKIGFSAKILDDLKQYLQTKFTEDNGVNSNKYLEDLIKQFSLEIAFRNIDFTNFDKFAKKYVKGKVNFNNKNNFDNEIVRNAMIIVSYLAKTQKLREKANQTDKFNGRSMSGTKNKRNKIGDSITTYMSFWDNVFHLYLSAFHVFIYPFAITVFLLWYLYF